METITYSVVIPVYKNEESVPELVAGLDRLVPQLDGPLEVVFVSDGSPDRSFELLRQRLPAARFASQLLLLSRNFGAFSAISAGLEAATGDYVVVIAADLQEPPELPLEFFRELRKGDCDLVLGQRLTRGDPFLSRVMANCFWFVYRKFVQRDMPPGGIDVFGCNRSVRQVLIKLAESNTSLVGLLLWMGFRRRFVGYNRQPRPYGKSAWSFKRKWRYLKDSLFAFSDLPLRILGGIGVVGLLLALGLGTVVLAAKLTGRIAVPGYAAEMTLIMFFGGLNALGLSLLGEYLWRTFENTKVRPRFIVFEKMAFPAKQAEVSPP